jgi:hypothetical protein
MAKRSPDTISVKAKPATGSAAGSIAALSIIKPEFTLIDMERFALEAWGEFGMHVVKRWSEFNDRFFGGELHPIPLVLTNTQPYGRRLAFCSHNPDGPHHRTITVNVPSYRGKPAPATYRLLADNGVLVHEMIHQLLQQRGENSSHMSDGWRAEVMRLTEQIAGRRIWAGRSKTMRVEGDDGKRSKIIRANEDGPNGEKSLGQDEIARWPHTVGITLGHLGAQTEVVTKTKRTQKARA